MLRREEAAANGVLYVLDEVLEPLPPSVADALVFGRRGDLSLFCDLLIKSGLMDALGEYKGPLTVLAPPNSAFESLGLELFDRFVLSRPTVEAVRKGMGSRV